MAYDQKRDEEERFERCGVRPRQDTRPRCIARERPVELSARGAVHDMCR